MGSIFEEIVLSNFIVSEFRFKIVCCRLTVVTVNGLSIRNYARDLPSLVMGANSHMHNPVYPIPYSSLSIRLVTYESKYTG
jgi:hypothetical protein